jgi:hypothetical protein
LAISVRLHAALCNRPGPAECQGIAVLAGHSERSSSTRPRERRGRRGNPQRSAGRSRPDRKQIVRGGVFAICLGGVPQAPTRIARSEGSQRARCHRLPRESVGCTPSRWLEKHAAGATIVYAAGKWPIC